MLLPLLLVVLMLWLISVVMDNYIVFSMLSNNVLELKDSLILLFAFSDSYFAVNVTWTH